MSRGVDATLAPIAGRAEIEFRRDTGTSEELSTPANFQRTREYRSLYSDDAVGSRGFRAVPTGRASVAGPARGVAGESGQS